MFLCTTLDFQKETRFFIEGQWMYSTVQYMSDILIHSGIANTKASELLVFIDLEF